MRFRRPGAIELFSVEPRAAQLIVRGRATVDVAGREHLTGAGISAIDLAGLQPSTHYDVVVDGLLATSFTTPREPGGPVLGRIATISDLHIGEAAFAFWPRSSRGIDLLSTHPVLCLEAAIEEINAWGADLVVVKGDIAHRPTAQNYDLLAKLLGRSTAPLMVLPGNHDGGNRQGVDTAAALAPHGIRLVETLDTVELPGACVVGASTRWPGTGSGRLDADLADAIVREARRSAAARRPTLLFVHHQFMARSIPYYWPVGIARHHGNAFLDRLADANPATLVSSGHTHRHRRRHHGALVLTEVGSVKDHPGTWAGYTLYAGAVVQHVRRVAEADALAWTEHTGRAVATAWGRWSPGRLDDRCFVHHWPADDATGAEVQPGRTAPT